MNPLAESKVNILGINEIAPPIHKISFFNNTKPNAEIIIQTIYAHLNGIEFILSEKPAGAPASQQELKTADKGDIVILALGDCGSCVTWLILDAIRLEKKGTATISICSDKFSSFARKLAQRYGFKDLRIIEISHPLAGLKKEEVEHKTLSIIPKIKNILNIS